MLGASRSGKTSILASMLNNVRNPNADNNVNKHFYVRDISDYTGIEDPNRLEEISLQANVDGMQDLLTPPIDNTYVPKMAKLTGSKASFTYAFDVKAKINDLVSEQKIDINFLDIPGELCSCSKFNMIADEISKAQLLIVAVDVPSLMYAKETCKQSLNTVMNCPEEVFDAVQLLGTGNCIDIKDEKKRNKELANQLRMVIFVPIKCEHWLQNGKRKEINDEIKRVYANTIEHMTRYNNVQVLILPVETIGSCVFDHYSEENNSLILLYGRKPNNRLCISEDTIDGYNTVRCERISEKLVRLKNGVLYNLATEDKIINAKSRKHHPYCYDGGSKLIPYVWFKPTGSKYAPRYCELLFCQILKFSIMDFAKRTGRSAREAFDNAHNFWQKLWALPDYLGRLFSGHTATYSNVRQVKLFQAKILAIELMKIWDENPITYLVNREDGKNI